MTTPEQIYAAVVIGLLLAAIGISIPVLKGIYRDGLERQSERRHNDLEAEATVAEPTASDDATGDRKRLSCQQCGVENDPAFTYCRNCLEPL
ncbi:hypothetical protein BDK88_1210 [Natrinema hispanicum]|uniref:DUF7577 domain-containing protein n=1 Tax=Natrinema hispanicum TaxID=392421 RepID=A0A482YCY9_9EURY|nr:zinc ribbon domain-containing protein [Natrinema hispanicum]RZV12306.1 hypothetical protein BDK88_1210 [Natrinema hispanicum]